jgi:hypothetical protein
VAGSPDRPFGVSFHAQFTVCNADERSADPLSIGTCAVSIAFIRIGYAPYEYINFEMLSNPVRSQLSLETQLLADYFRRTRH